VSLLSSLDDAIEGATPSRLGRNRHAGGLPRKSLRKSRACAALRAPVKLEWCRSSGDALISGSLTNLEYEAMKLPREQRARLVDHVLSSMHANPEVDEAWAAEVQRRIAAIDSGTPLVAAETAFARALGLAFIDEVERAWRLPREQFMTAQRGEDRIAASRCADSRSTGCIGCTAARSG
jgi:putative addiction module component (TIGR02574 family)